MTDRDIERLGVFAGQGHDLADRLRRERPSAPRHAPAHRSGARRSDVPPPRRMAPHPATGVASDRLSLRHIPSCCAVSSTPRPAAASKTIRARSASFCGVECARTRSVSSRSCSAESCSAEALKPRSLPRAPAGFTAMALDGYGLRDILPARPTCLISGCCSSGRDFAPRFLQTVPRGSALALHSCFTSIRLHRGLSPPGCWTCPAHRTLRAIE